MVHSMEGVPHDVTCQGEQAKSRLICLKHLAELPTCDGYGRSGMAGQGGSWRERDRERERERGVEHGGAGEGDVLGNLVC